MVASQKVEVLWEFDFVCEKKGDGLDTLLTSVDVVTNKQELLLVLGIPRNIK